MIIIKSSRVKRIIKKASLEEVEPAHIGVLNPRCAIDQFIKTAFNDPTLAETDKVAARDARDPFGAGIGASTESCHFIEQAEGFLLLFCSRPS